MIVLFNTIKLNKRGDNIQFKIVQSYNNKYVFIQMKGGKILCQTGVLQK